jgi:glycosyltransferase involved in cell wall biosynthesis
MRSSASAESGEGTVGNPREAGSAAIGPNGRCERAVHLLFIVPEPWPTHRPDVSVLFGRELPRCGIRSDLVAGAWPAIAGAVAWGGGQAWLYELRGGAVRRSCQMALHAIAQLLRGGTGPFDAIQVRDLPLLAALALPIARLRGWRFFYWMSFPIPEASLALARERRFADGIARGLVRLFRGGIGRLMLDRIVLPRADHVFVQSDQMREALADRIPRARMTPVPMGVDLAATEAPDLAAAADPRLRGRRVLVYLGVMDRIRRIEILLEMLVSLQGQHSNVLLVMVGDTQDAEYRSWLQSRAEQLGVAELVLWTGWLPTRDAWRYVRAAEVGLSPIPRGPLLDVGSPTKPLEYLALGVPVVGNDNPEQARLLHESGGGLCVPWSADAFARGASTIMAMPKEERARMAACGRSYISERRDYRVIASGLANVYRDLVQDDDDGRA